MNFPGGLICGLHLNINPGTQSIKLMKVNDFVRFSCFCLKLSGFLSLKFCFLFLLIANLHISDTKWRLFLVEFYGFFLML